MRLSMEAMELHATCGGRRRRGVPLDERSPAGPQSGEKGKCFLGKWLRSWGHVVASKLSRLTFVLLLFG